MSIAMIGLRARCPRWMIAVCLTVGLALAAERTRVVAAEANAPIGRKIDGFTLRDYRGKEHQLADLTDKQVVVVAFLGTECPLAKMYAPRLQELAESYADRGVAFVGINSNRQDGVTVIGAYARRHGVEFPILKDPGNVVADQFGAVRTPEVFVLDGERVVRYWGAIDDQYGIGYQRDKPERRVLAAAIDDVLAGRDVAQPVTEAPGCRIGRVRPVVAGGEVTYSKHIAPIFQARCVECHRAGEIAPFALDSYESSVGWAETIRDVVREGRMPPWHADPAHGVFSNNSRLTDEQRQLIDRWVELGAPEGDPSDLPPPRTFTVGWQIDEPEAVFMMAQEPTKIPAEGVLSYRNFVVDPGFTEDKWVVQAEARPGNRAIVHHIIVFIQPPGEEYDGHLFSNFFCATAPGAKPLLLTDGYAKRIPAGSKLVFQMHYTPNGSPQEDLSQVGMVFTSADQVTREVTTGSAISPFLLIPPNADNHEVLAYKTFRRDSLLISLYPHMHLRGKAFRYVARYPDGRRETLLDVPRYDFNWQNTYVLTEPKLMPKGTTLECVAHFDNSEHNLANPDPNATVTFGEQTFDEMMIGFFDAAPAEVLTPEQRDADAQAERNSQRRK